MIRSAQLLCRQSDVFTPADGVKISQAFGLFGFKLNESVSRTRLKKKYRQLLLKHHPDHGGTNENFRLLQESYKLLDRYADDPLRKPIECNRVTHDEGSGYNRVSTSKESLTDGWDVLAMFFGISLLLGWLARRQALLHQTLYVKNFKMKHEELEPPTEEAVRDPKQAWHAWRADDRPFDTSS